MSDNASEKNKNCKVCKKALIDEKVPICLRCKLTLKKNAFGVGKWVGGFGVGALGLLTAFGNS